MELTYAQCEKILKILPIGYYAGRKVNVTISDKEETSYYNPIEDSITISFPIIQKRVEHLSDGVDEEGAVRAMLYHEVSHAIMTNSTEFICNEVTNIFEDERIETVLNDYYLNTDFKKQLLDIYGGKIPSVKTDKDAFYNIVRFRSGPKKYTDEVEKIIEDFATLCRITSSHREVTMWWSYYDRVMELYREIVRDFKKDPEVFSNKDASSTVKGGVSYGENDNDDNNNEDVTNDDDMPASFENDNSENDNSVNSPLTKEQIKEIVNKALSHYGNMNAADKAKLNDFARTISMIISNFNKKNSGGAGVNAYTGVFNPRAAARKDYRYFEHSLAVNGNNKFGSCHLNLFIDSSGSMYNNESIINGMLAVLTDIERKNRNFSMDVSFINHNYMDCDTVASRRYYASGGNKIPEDMKQRLIKRQKNGTCNYNIILFDGDALSDDYDLKTPEKIKRFHTLDYKQTTLIIDDENKVYLGDGFHSSKVVVTKNYTDELLNHITKAITIAFG